jgi:hypothetical protein
MWNHIESLNVVWNYSCIIVLFHCFDFALLFIYFCCFLSVVLFLSLTSFLVRNKIMDQFFHNDVILQVLLINKNQVTQLS